MRWLTVLMVVCFGPIGHPAAAQDTNAGDEALTVVITRFAKPGCSAALEAAMQEIIDARADISGYLSTDILRPANPRDTRYQIIIKFERRSNWQRWSTQAEGRDVLKRIDALTEGDPDYRYLTGLETLFTPPDSSLRQTPPRYKQAVVTWLTIFPLVLITSAVTGPFTAGAPQIVRTLVMTGILVPTMTYAAMPTMLGWFEDWLYPTPAACHA